ncbi:MAG: IS200/IS605 family transposase [Anaerolineae bacterium]|nr:IS200/IS605 family transposase [Anaerolineae bacterium]
MAYWVCHYHIVWATYGRQPIITPTLEPLIAHGLQRASEQLGCRLLAHNGPADHLHAAVSIPPSLPVSRWVGAAKGLASREVNIAFPNAPERFRWQTGYSVHSFGERHLHEVLAYIQDQKHHHANQTTNVYLEYLDPADSEV